MILLRFCKSVKFSNAYAQENVSKTVDSDILLNEARYVKFSENFRRFGWARALDLRGRKLW